MSLDPFHLPAAQGVPEVSEGSVCFPSCPVFWPRHRTLKEEPEAFPLLGIIEDLFPTSLLPLFSSSLVLPASDLLSLPCFVHIFLGFYFSARSVSLSLVPLPLFLFPLTYPLALTVSAPAPLSPWLGVRNPGVSPIQVW